MNRIGSERVLVPHLIAKRVKTQQEPHCKRRTRAQASSSRQIGNVVNLNSRIDTHELQASAHGRMLKRAVLVYVLNSRIGNAAVVFEERRQMPARNVAALINRSGEYRAAEFSKPNWIIGAATEERNTERSARCNHKVCFLLFIGISKRI